LLRPSNLLAAALLLTTLAHAAPLTETIAPNHLVVVYRNGIPANAEAQITAAGGHVTHRLDRFHMVALSTSASDTQARLATQPSVAAVLNDRYITAHSIMVSADRPNVIVELPGTLLPPSILHPISYPVVFMPAPTDTYYASPQGWAVQQSGGFGDNVPTSPSTTANSGPWNISRGAGVRIAILDSGVDQNHPDISPNLAFNLSEINQNPQTGLPSPCDDGSPQDQTGHGTWTASLATGALGLGTGLVVGVAPQATLLNIKVLQRMPGTGTSTVSACEAGQAGGLLSWVLQGIDDAVANHANVISLSLGTLIDITTGDGAGWKAQFDAVTYAAAQSGTIIVAAMGNDGLNLSPNGPNSRFLELPAQARSVLAVVASTNPACAENLAANATCAPGPITTPYYSNYGATGAIAAPGGSYPEGPSSSTSGFIMGACSTGLTNTTEGLPSTGQSFGCFNLGHVQYVQAMGTSAAAPLVAGAAAILRAAHPTWTATQIITTLQTTANKLPSTPTLNLPAALTLN
jgi:lantibiotic leader peptide-processing serine protease